MRAYVCHAIRLYREYTKKKDVNSGSKNFSFRCTVSWGNFPNIYLLYISKHYSFLKNFKHSARSIRYEYTLYPRWKARSCVKKYDFHLIHRTGNSVVAVASSRLTKSRQLASAPRNIHLHPDVLYKKPRRTLATNRREKASALRQHLRFGTHECCKPTWIGRKAACERERWMRTDDVKWIGQTDRRDRHNSPSKQYLGGAHPLGDTCRFPSGNIGLSSLALPSCSQFVAFRKTLYATRPLCIAASNSFAAVPLPKKPFLFFVRESDSNVCVSKTFRSILSD